MRMTRLSISLLSIAMFTMSLTAHAGFEGLNQGASLKLFNRINCGEGLSCTKIKDKFNIVQSGIFTGDMVGDGTGEIVGYLNNQVVATATTITAAQCGSTFINAGAIEMELPEASTVLGCRLTFIVGNATAFTIDPDAADQIMLLTDAAGDSLIADAVGESLVIEAISASAWAVVGAEKGTWTDSN